MSDFGKGINVQSKDIVYRQDVEDMLRNALPSRGMWEIEGDAIKNAICETVADLMMDLEKLPSADPARKKGAWIANGDIPQECPFCGEDWDKYVFGDVCYTGELPKFCPNCGEDMRKGEEE